MKKGLIFILCAIGVFSESANADIYRGVYKCNLHGVEYESTSKCPSDATTVRSGMNFNYQGMTTRQNIGLRNNTSAFEIKERYKKYRDDLKWNNTRNNDQDYLARRLAELDRNEQIELSQLAR